MSLPKHLNLNGKSYSGAGFHAFVGNLSSEPTFIRIAYKRDKDARWKLSGRMSLSIAGIYIDKLTRSMSRGEGYVHFLHDMKTHQRESVRERLKRRRVFNERRRELRAVENLPTFGMF